MGSKKISALTANTNPSLTGVTIFDDGTTSYKTSLSTLKQVLVDSGSHYFTGSQTISGSLNVINSVTASYFVGNGSQLTNLPYSVSGSGSHIGYFSTPSHITSSNAMHIVNDGNTMALGTVATSTPAERLMVDVGNFNIATFQTSTNNNYAQVNIKNFNSGSNASADLVLWNDVATESSSYVNLGINSSTNDGSSVGYAGDGYLFNERNDLYVGSFGLNHGHLHLFGRGRYARPQISIFTDKTIGFNVNIIDTGSLETIPSSINGYTYEFSGSVQLNNRLKVNSFTILSEVSSSLNFLDDTAAAAGGVPLGGLYRDGNTIKIRLT